MLRSPNSDPASLGSTIQNAIWSVEKNQPVPKLESVEQMLAEQVAEPRLYTLLLGVFSGVALLLAAVGIYGLISYSVAMRTREIGIRMSLGASRGQVLKLVVRQGLMLTMTGMIVGLVAAFALTRVMTSLLFGVSATDPATFAGIPLLLAAVALGACLLPASRATKVDPTVALRYE